MSIWGGVIGGRGTGEGCTLNRLGSKPRRGGKEAQLNYIWCIWGEIDGTQPK